MEKKITISLKCAGTACNMNCIYCAEKRKSDIDSSNSIKMDLISKIAEMFNDFSMNIIFHGGEPTLLKSDYYEQIMEYFQKKCSNVSFGMQTNAYAIDNEWINFFDRNRNRLGISISLDGPKQMNDYRLGSKNDYSYDEVNKNLLKLEEKHICVGVIVTITKKSLNREKELIEYLNGFSNIKFVKLNPCFDKDDDGIGSSWAISPRQYMTFVNNFFDIYVKESYKNYLVEPIISILKKIQGVESSFCNFSNEKCHNFLCVYPDGKVTYCDNLEYNDGYIGNLYDFDNLAFEKENTEKELTINNNLAQCYKCDVYNICTGGCNEIRKKYGIEYCESMKNIIDYIESFYRSIEER